MHNFQMIMAVFIGWMCGYIVNYLADVLPHKRKLSRPICIQCQKDMSVKHFLLVSACAHCKTHRSLRTWVVQVFMVSVCVFFFLFPPDNTGVWLSVLVVTYFMVVSVIDWEHRVVLIETAIVGVVITLPIGIYLHGLLPTLLGALVGFGLTYIFYLLGLGFSKILSKVKPDASNEVAFGFGDVYLSIILGLILGWPGIIAGIILGTLIFALTGGIYLVYLLAAKRYKFSTALPMAPFLIFGSAILLFRSAFGF